MSVVRLANIINKFERFFFLEKIRTTGYREKMKNDKLRMKNLHAT